MTAWSIPMQQYRSKTAAVRPSSLVDGQLFLNQADGVLCWPNAAGAVQVTSLTEASGTNIAPVAPVAGKVSFGYTAHAKRELLGMQGSAAALTPLQANVTHTRIAYWSGVNGSATLNVEDAVAPPALGTPTVRYTNVTNTFTRVRRIGYVSAATAGSSAGWYSTFATWFLGTGSAYGFLASFTFGCADAAAVSGARQFVGMSASTVAPTNVEPSTLTNVIGIGHGASDTNLKLYCSGTAAQTPIDLGANFPANTLSTDVYRFTIWAGQDGAINYQVDRLGTAFSASGTFPNATPGTTAPANNNSSTILGPRLWRCNNATALAVALDVACVSIQTDGY